MRFSPILFLSILLALTSQCTVQANDGAATPNYIDANSPILIASSDDSEFELGKMDSAPANGPLTKEQLDQLLERRLPGIMGMPFSRFANMILVPGKAKSGEAINLDTTSDKIGKTALRSPYPEWYRPTLRQFLDEVATQTKSTWKYEYDEKTAKKKLEGGNNEVKRLTLFEFSEGEKPKTFELEPSAGWAATDNGNWISYVPQGSPVSVDVYEMGIYSALEKDVEPELLKRVPYDVAFEWARRVQHNAKTSDLSAAKVGTYDAVFFEAKVKSQSKQDVHWRQWVFMDGHQCYFIVSTMFPDQESKLLPDVQAMLKSFHTKH